MTFLKELIKELVRQNRSSLANRLRRKLYRTSCQIDTGVVITNPDRFKADKGTALYHACYILNDNGSFRMGQNSHLGAFCYANVACGEVTIGDDVAIGPGTKIIAYSNHYASGRKVTEERTVGNIVIGNNVFIGANCTILPGTVIEDHVVVAAGAVVKGTLKSNCIYGGVPCKQIKTGWYEDECTTR